MAARPWFQWLFMWGGLVGVWWALEAFCPSPPWREHQEILTPLHPRALKPLPQNEHETMHNSNPLTRSNHEVRGLAFLDSVASDLPEAWALKGNTSAWFALHGFFRRLERAESRRVEVYHWGDSQIEGDRITGLMRASWQQRFGGRGPGWVLPNTPAQTTATLESQRGTLIRKAGFGRGKTRDAMRLPFFAINTALDTVRWSVQGATKSSASLGAWTLSEVWLTDTTHQAALWTESNSHPESVAVQGNAQGWRHAGQRSPVQFAFVDLTTTGVFLGSESGVLVHNLPMRGASGTLFDNVDQVHWDALREAHPPSLIVLQYGGNAVPGVASPAQARTYARHMATNIRFLRDQFPGVPVVFVGPSDMGASESSYPGLPWVIGSLKEAVWEAGALYWDVQSVMGGPGSMAQWVENGWASEDHVHFTRRGAREIATRLEWALNVEWKSMRP